MATNLKKFVGLFYADTTLTTPFVQHITAPGFQPKLVIFFSTGSAISGTLTSSNRVGQTLGVADGTNSWSITWTSVGTVTTTSISTSQNNDRCVTLATGSSAGAVGTAAMTANGFDITWTAQPQRAGAIGYIALGGSDIENVAFGTLQQPGNSTPANRSATGLGFTPNFVFFLTSGGTAFPSSSFVSFNYGCMTASAQFAESLTVQNGQTVQANVNAQSIHSTSACLQTMAPSTGLRTSKISFVSMDSGGFTVSCNPVSINNVFIYVAIGGANLKWDIATAARPTSATTQSRTGLTFQPEVTWWSNSDVTTLDTETAPAAISFGASDGTTTESLYCTEDDTIPTVAGTQSAADAVQDGDPANTSVLGAFTSFNSDGWTITWGGTGTANLISSVSLAGTEAGTGVVGYISDISPDFQWLGGEIY